MAAATASSSRALINSAARMRDQLAHVRKTEMGVLPVRE
jgi:hypothetical protein